MLMNLNHLYLTKNTACKVSKQENHSWKYGQSDLKSTKNHETFNICSNIWYDLW